MASGRDSSQRADPGVQAARSCDNAGMKLSAKADYAVRAVLVLASHDDPHPLKGELIAASQDLPLKFVENILGELKHAGLVVSQRGPEGGYRLAVPADQITVAEVIRVVDGPLAAVAGVRPEAISYPPGAEALPDVWLQARSQLRSVLENVTFADLVQRSRERAASSRSRPQERALAHKPAYLIAGSDWPKIDAAAVRLRSQFDDDSVEQIAVGEEEAADVVASCNALGLFGGERLVLVRGVEGLDEAQVQDIIGYLADPTPGTCLAMFGGKGSPRTDRWRPPSPRSATSASSTRPTTSTPSSGWSSASPSRASPAPTASPGGS